MFSGRDGKIRERLIREAIAASIEYDNLEFCLSEIREKIERARKRRDDAIKALRLADEQASQSDIVLLYDSGADIMHIHRTGSSDSSAKVVLREFSTISESDLGHLPSDVVLRLKRFFES